MRRTRERVLGLVESEDDGAPAPVLQLERGTASLELSIIIPARNEERNLPGCLQSLLAQSESGFELGRHWEIIVVDDSSSDQTRAVATGVQHQLEEERRATDAGEGGASLTAAPPDLASVTLAASVPRTEPLHVFAPPDQGHYPRMTGKSNACWAGAQSSLGAHLLFTDADTLFEPGALSRSLREADRHGVTLLSYSPRQIMTGLVQHLLMPLIFSELVSVYPPQQVSDPTRPIAAANGQFLLVEREAYFRIGGHRALGRNILEDVALSRRVKSAGEPIRLRYAPEAVATRMYSSTPEMVEGWTKNLAALMPTPVSLALWRLLDLALLFGLPLLSAGLPHLVLWQRAALLLLWLRTGLRFYTRVARAHFSFLPTAASPLGLPLLIFLLLRSVVAYRLTRRVSWKGRTYDPNQT